MSSIVPLRKRSEYVNGRLHIDADESGDVVLTIVAQGSGSESYRITRADAISIFGDVSKYLDRCGRTS